MKHDWQPTDSQGHCMQCTKCGKYVCIMEGREKEWNKNSAENCPGKK